MELQLNRIISYRINMFYIPILKLQSSSKCVYDITQRFIVFFGNETHFRYLLSAACCRMYEWM